MFIRRSFAVGCVLIPLAFACERTADDPTAGRTEGPVEGTPEPLRTGPVLAAESIAQARCDREQRCGNIGADEDYASREACLTEVREEWRDDLNALDCPGGVNQEQLNACLEEVRDEECGRPFQTLGRIMACRSGAICEATAE